MLVFSLYFTFFFLITSLSPTLIIISSGFDAVRGDLIGDCLLTPECYYLMTKSIVDAVDGYSRDCSVGIVVALEGGYNLDVIPLCMEAVAAALLGDKYD